MTREKIFSIFVLVPSSSKFFVLFLDFVELRIKMKFIESLILSYKKHVDRVLNLKKQSTKFELWGRKLLKNLKALVHSKSVEGSIDVLKNTFSNIEKRYKNLSSRNDEERVIYDFGWKLDFLLKSKRNLNENDIKWIILSRINEVQKKYVNLYTQNINIYQGTVNVTNNVIQKSRKRKREDDDETSRKKRKKGTENDPIIINELKSDDFRIPTEYEERYRLKSKKSNFNYDGIYGGSTELDRKKLKMVKFWSKDVLNKERFLKKLFDNCKIGLKGYHYEGFIRELKQSHYVFVLSGKPKKFLKKYDRSLLFKGTDGKFYLPLSFAFFRICKDFFQIIIMCTDLEIKEYSGTKGAGSILLDHLKWKCRKIVKKANKKGHKRYRTLKLFAFSDDNEKTVQFYKNRGFVKVEKEEEVKSYLKQDLHEQDLYENDVKVCRCDLYMYKE